MTDEVEFIAQELRDHADSVDDAAGVLEQALGASAHVAMGKDAYGALCAMLPLALDVGRVRFEEVLGLADDALDGTVDALRFSASGFEREDVANAEQIWLAGDGVAATEGAG
ncbi:MAG: type VII secretion target [Stackebrandtia sp.]